ncbi:MAG: GNAT family N-acetyltransferase [Acidimicrobiia bacterium]
MTTVIALQARMGSTRLPGKVLRPLLGRPMLQYQLERLRVRPEPIVVATSDLERDDPVADLAATLGVDCVRGSEADVLARFGAVLDRTGATTVVRLTGDCPFTDPAVVGLVLDRHRVKGADYTSNVHPRTFPQGLDVEVAEAEALRIAIDEARAPAEREHVMPFLYRRPDRFGLAAVTSGEPLGHLRWVVDTTADFERAEVIAASFAPRVDQTWREILAVPGAAGPAPDRSGVRLRSATIADRDLLLALRNDADAVRWSTTAAGVTTEEHDAWLAVRLQDPACRLWIVELDGRPVGQLRVDVVDVATGVVSIAVDPAARGRGVAAAALHVLQDVVRGDVQIDRLRAVVHAGNEPSRRVFAGAGFTTVRGVAAPGGFEVHEWAQAPGPERRESI